MTEDERDKEDARGSKPHALDRDSTERVADDRNRKDEKQRVAEGADENAGDVTGLLFGRSFRGRIFSGFFSRLSFLSGVGRRFRDGVFLSDFNRLFRSGGGRGVLSLSGD